MDEELSAYDIDKVTLELYTNNTDDFCQAYFVKLLSLTWTDEIAHKIDWGNVKLDTLSGDYGTIFRIAEDSYINSTAIVREIWIRNFGSKVLYFWELPKLLDFQIKCLSGSFFASSDLVLSIVQNIRLVQGREIEIPFMVYV